MFLPETHCILRRDNVSSWSAGCGLGPSSVVRRVCRATVLIHDTDELDCGRVVLACPYSDHPHSGTCIPPVEAVCQRLMMKLMAM